MLVVDTIWMSFFNCLFLQVPYGEWKLKAIFSPGTSPSLRLSDCELPWMSSASWCDKPREHVMLCGLLFMLIPYVDNRVLNQSVHEKIHWKLTIAALDSCCSVLSEIDQASSTGDHHETWTQIWRSQTLCTAAEEVCFKSRNLKAWMVCWWYFLIIAETCWSFWSDRLITLHNLIYIYIRICIYVYMLYHKCI